MTRPTDPTGDIPPTGGPEKQSAAPGFGTGARPEGAPGAARARTAATGGPGAGVTTTGDPGPSATTGNTGAPGTTGTTGNTGALSTTGNTDGPSTASTPGITDTANTTTGTGGSLLPQDECDRLALRMQEAAAGFVDGPRDAVEEADHVLEDIAARFTEAMTNRRRGLRASLQPDGTTSGSVGPAGDTEQLRLALKDYRDLAERLLRV
jgi:hypothetical protein